MRGRADLLIFVLVSLALERREGLPRVQLRSLSPAGRPPQARLHQGAAHDRRTRVARCTLSYGLNADGVARWSPRAWAGSSRASRPGGMMFSTHLATKKLSIKY